MTDEKNPQMGLWQRLVGIITRPGATLAAVVEKPTILWPALVISLANLALYIVTAPKMQQFMLWSFENMPKDKYTAEQLAGMKAYLTSTSVYVNGATMVIMPFVIWLVMALMFKFLNLFTGNEAPFKNLYAVAVITNIPILIGSALRSVMVAMSPAENYMTVTTSAALALPKGETGALFAVLSSIDPFYFWSLALMAMGAALVLKTTVKKTGFAVLIAWVLFTVISALIMNSQQMPGA